MAGKPKRMSQVKQILQLHHNGKKKKEIARILKVSVNTVKSYLRKVDMLKMDVPSLLALEDPVLEARLHAGNPSYKENIRYDHFINKIPYFFEELKKTGVTRHLLWEEYRQAYPKGYGYTQFCFHLAQQKKVANPSMVIPHKPGEKIYIDFTGKTTHYIDRETGEVITCQVFVACLPYSDYAFVMAVRSQCVEDFIYSLRCCLEAFGGVPEIMVPDNLKSAIVKANRYEPGVNQVLEDFANHYQTTVVPTRVCSPQDKALVENQVKMIYTRVFARLRNVQFFDIQSLNAAITDKTRDHNQTRMQQKKYCREEQFLSKEKPLLSPLPEEPFEIKYYRKLTVAKNNHVLLQQDKHHYSVPYQYIGSKVKVIYTRSMVYFYIKGELVAIHPRVYHPGYSTSPDHLCSTHRHYLDRSPEYYLQKALKISPELHELFSLMFAQKRHPEQVYRSCQGILSLQRKTSEATFKKACSMAMEVEQYTYGFIQNIIKNKMTEIPEIPKKDTLPEHKNIRGKAYYKQSTLNFDNNETT